jgi:alpha-1,6-mannosyltransferase
MIVLGGVQKLREAVRAKFGDQTALWHLLITTSQFHVMFYASRPLPNTFAMVLVMYAMAFWLQDSHAKFVMTSAFAIVVFRAELALLLGTVLLMDLAVGRAKFLPTIAYGLLALIVSLAITVGVDSFMWQDKWLWPEGRVLFYNVVLNKSSNWGVSPWPWYFYSAIPRAMFTTAFFVPIGVLLDRRTLLLVLPCLAFVTLYSFLPHKELRFIIYVFPLLNTVAAEACKRLWQGAAQKPTPFRKLLAMVAVMHLVVNVAFTAMMLHVSRHNYPGGVALTRLHEEEVTSTPANVHIDVYAAQTGVSRFTQISDTWLYNKTENLSLEKLATFTHLLVEHEDHATIDGLSSTHDILFETNSFRGLTDFNLMTFPPFKLKMSSAVTVLRRKTFLIV